MLNKAQALCGIFCVFELHQFEIGQYKNTNKISCEKFDSMMEMIVKPAVALTEPGA